MQVTVKLFAFFRDNRFKVKDLVFEEGTTVAMIIESLGIPQAEVGVIMRNGRHCQPETVPEEKDVLGIFPVIGGG
ncbi:MAG: MoaD/ThiS family protein [Desulfopila sp.]